MAGTGMGATDRSQSVFRGGLCHVVDHHDFHIQLAGPGFHAGRIVLRHYQVVSGGSGFSSPTGVRCDR
jgi:hypothetical protein